MPFRSALLTNQNCVLDAMFTNSKFDAHQRGESIAIKHNVFTEKNENGKRNLKKIFYFATVPLYGKTKRPPSSDPVCVCTDYCQRQQSSFKVNLKKNRFHQPNPQDNLKKKWTRIHLRDQEIENPTPPELILPARPTFFLLGWIAHISWAYRVAILFSWPRVLNIIVKIFHKVLPWHLWRHLLHKELSMETFDECVATWRW